ncbi:dihydrofolate reductase family protein [Subtercola sp. RTI3]|uniref:dihydrofolate reductase family protein n=1 Tax=Subtercola sp. RTI3 TaxID=3048639 RepID=UPI002B22ADFA|nr:dihydrofolate reductase family protein [Subtercola sp. RTI3]MEA9983829.1 dihydrofolate reductase family protein [Subtercola sp. RTI3]
MRKLSAGLFHSIDGVVEAPNLWQGDSFDAELGDEMGSLLARVDSVILGRIGYQQWSGYWPNAGPDDPFAIFINPVQKFVASNTLSGTLEWQNSELIEGDLDTFIRHLKNIDGGEISLMGGISLVRHLLFAGLLDELTLITHPVIAGAGRHLFTTNDPITPLVLLRSSTTSKGNVLTTYGLRKH